MSGHSKQPTDAAHVKEMQTYRPKHKIRFVTAAALFDGHDVSINIMRRLLQLRSYRQPCKRTYRPFASPATRAVTSNTFPTYVSYSTRTKANTLRSLGAVGV